MTSALPPAVEERAAALVRAVQVVHHDLKACLRALQIIGTTFDATDDFLARRAEALP